MTKDGEAVFRTTLTSPAVAALPQDTGREGAKRPSVRQFSSSFCKPSGTAGPAGRANGDFVAVSREWFPQVAIGDRGNPLQ